MSLHVVTNPQELVSVCANGSAVTTGTFDGIHRGHQAIVKKLSQVALEKSLPPVVVTFDPHPREVIRPGQGPKLLTTLDEKRIELEKYFAGHLCVVPFNDEVKGMTAEQFVSDILIKQLSVKQLVVGYDHVLGKDRGGTVAALQQLGNQRGYGVEVVEPYLYAGKPVSSSRARESISEGDMALTEALLGREYLIRGTVERGIGMGRKLGYPTANLKVSERKLLPKEGIYACRCHLNGETISGMLFIGRNWLNPAGGTTVEINLFDFDRQIYGATLDLYPYRRIRDNQRFESPEALTAQIAKDKQHVLEVIDKGEKTWQ